MGVFQLKEFGAGKRQGSVEKQQRELTAIACVICLTSTFAANPQSTRSTDVIWWFASSIHITLDPFGSLFTFKIRMIKKSRKNTHVCKIVVRLT